MIPAPTRMLTLNAERKMHHQERAEIVRLWREAAWALAKQQGVKAMDRVHVTAYIDQKGSVLADAGNHYPTVKAIIDGLVDAKVIPEDDGRHVLSVRQFAALRADENRVTIHLEEC